MTGKYPPTAPRTAREYSEAGLPWFAYYEDDATAVGGSTVLKGLKNIVTLGKKKGSVPLPENESCTPLPIVFKGSRLELNVNAKRIINPATRDYGVRVEITDPLNQVLPEHSYRDCDPICQDSEHCPVT